MPNYQILLHPKSLTKLSAYDSIRHLYNPPAPYRNWAELVQDQRLRLKVAGNLRVLGV